MKSNTHWAGISGLSLTFGQCYCSKLSFPQVKGLSYHQNHSQFMQEKRIFGYLVTASLPKNTLQAETTFSQCELVFYLGKPVHTKKMYNSVILLQIVMVNPGTHLVKNRESQSITNESWFKETRSPKLKMLEPLCNPRQLIWRQTPKLSSLLKLKCSPSIYLKHKKD